MSPKKKPRSRAEPLAGKGAQRPKVLHSGADAEGSHDRPVISFLYADRQYKGSWSWPAGVAAEEMLTLLAEITKLTWAEIALQQTGPPRRRRPKHHRESFGDVCNEAQQRLAHLGHEDIFEDFFRFRFGGVGRMWGFTAAGVFYVLWWDPDHKVHPVP